MRMHFLGATDVKQKFIMIKYELNEKRRYE